MKSKQRVIKNELVSIVNNHIIDYPTPVNVTYFWSFGSLAGLCLVVQILTGVFLAMHYVPHVVYAFASVEHIMRDVNYGWFLRYTHANGASMFFILVYTHMFRGLYYGSYMKPREYLWCSGVLIFLLMMATGFVGYVLPWGQMSFWGATVITSLFSSIPVFGKYIVLWLWGGFSVDNPTLNRFFSLHFLLPFVIAGVVLLHLVLLHKVGSGDPIGNDLKINTVSFYPYFYYKDAFSLLVFLTFFMLFVFFAPNSLGDADNYILANISNTPLHIVPEWYFLPFYAILRSVPDKLLGVISMFAAIVILAVLPFIYNSEIRSPQFRPLFKFFFWALFFDFLILGWVGQNPVNELCLIIGQLASLFYFAYFLVIMPLLGKLEAFLLKSF